MSCKKAIGIAEELKEKFGDKLDLHIHTTDSPEALKYNFRSSTNVLIEEELVPLQVALNADELEKLFAEKLA